MVQRAKVLHSQWPQLTSLLKCKVGIFHWGACVCVAKQGCIFLRPPSSKDAEEGRTTPCHHEKQTNSEGGTEIRNNYIAKSTKANLAKKKEF